MAAQWESYTDTFGLTTVGTGDAEEIFHNEVDDHIFASAPITIVDGIVTLTGSINELAIVDMLICHESMTEANVEAVQRHEPLIWYRWHVALGPLVFRLRSKRTIPPEHKLWMRCYKEQGANAMDVHAGINLLMVRHP